MTHWKKKNLNQNDWGIPFRNRYGQTTEDTCYLGRNAFSHFPFRENGTHINRSRHRIPGTEIERTEIVIHLGSEEWTEESSHASRTRMYLKHVDSRMFLRESAKTLVASSPGYRLISDSHQISSKHLYLKMSAVLLTFISFTHSPHRSALSRELNSKRAWMPEFSRAEGTFSVCAIYNWFYSEFN